MVGYSPWRDAIKGVAGLGGKLLMGAADNFTGGLASKLLECYIRQPKKKFRLNR